MTLIEKIHAWVRKHTTVCGMTLEELDEYKERIEREARYQRMLKEYHIVQTMCYIDRSCYKSNMLGYDRFSAAENDAEEYMIRQYGKEWREAKEWRKEKGGGVE